MKHGEHGELTPRSLLRRRRVPTAVASRAASLFVVLALAKSAGLWGRPIQWSPKTIVAYFWQDVAVAVVFGALMWTFTRRRPSRLPLVLYGLVVFYVALNVPVARVLSTPLTWPMLRATSGTLADSILLYVTWTNGLLMVGILAAAAILPRILQRMPRRMLSFSRVAALLIVVFGLIGSPRIDTLGLHRNALVALGSSVLPRVDALTAAEDWTATIDSADRVLIDSRIAAGMSHLRGIGAGKNVVLISLESTAAQYLRLYGAAEDVTPHLDRLARNAVVFDNAYAVYPESIKGLFSIVCSTYPAFDTTPSMYVNAPCRSLAGALATAGYRTALFHSGRFSYLGMEAIIRNRGFETLEDAGDIGGNRESSFGVDEPATVTRVLSWIDALPAGQRFFVTYLPIAGHHPYETPDPGPFPGGDEIGRYRNALRYADESIGSLIAGLRARGLENDTVWVVLGDHGEAMGQHQANYGHTFFLYEENVRVPFVVAVPGAIGDTRRSPAPISLVDTAPTILDVLGLPIPPEHQGHSALDGRERMALFFTDYSLGFVGLRDGRWKFVHALDSDRSTLFDLERDRGETVDVSSDHQALAAGYKQRLLAWTAAQKGYVIADGR